MAHVIDAVIQLRDQFSGTLKNVNGNLSQFQRQASYARSNFNSVGKDMEKVGKTLSKTVTAPIIAVGTGLLALGKNFESAENTIRIGTGATGKDLENLNNDFENVYSQVGSSMADTSKAVADLNTRTGLAGKPLEDLSVQMLKLAKISGDDLNTLIPATTRMFQDAGIKQADYSKALDYTFKVSQNTGIGVARLQELMTQFGGPLRQMGFDWQTSGAMLGKFEKEGVNTELVVGSLRIALGKMAQQGIKDPSTALQIMITRIKDAGTAGQANSLALQMFGAKAGPDMAAAIREGRMDLDGLLKTLKNSPETINKAAGDTATFSGKLTKMRHQMEVAFEPIATKLLDSLDKLLPSLQKGANMVANFAQKIAAMPPAEQEMIVKFALIAAAVGPVLVTVSRLVLSISSTAKTFIDFSRTISNAGGMLKYFSGPAGIFLAIVTVVAIAALLLIKYWGPISSFFKKIWDDIKGPINTVKEKFQEFLDRVKDVKDKLLDLKDKAVKDVKKIFEDFTQSLKDHESQIKTVATVLGAIFAPALIKTGTQAVIAGGQIVVHFIASIIKTGTQAVISAAKTTGSFILSIIRSGTESVIAGAKITAGFIASLIKTAAQAVITGATITVSLIGSLIAYAAQGWKTVAAISAQTLALLAQKGMMLASAAVTGIMTAAQWALNAAMDANPIGAIILLIAGLVTAGILLYQNWDTVKQTLSDTWVGIKNAFIGGINEVIDALDWLIDKLNTIPGVSIPEIGRLAMDMSVKNRENANNTALRHSGDLGHNAAGTNYWRGGPTVVGELGPEIIDLPRGSRVTPNNKIGGNNINIHVNNPVIREEADIEKLANAIVLKLDAAAANM